MSADQADHRKANTAEDSLKNQGDKLAKQVDAVVEKTPEDKTGAEQEKPEDQGNRQAP